MIYLSGPISTDENYKEHFEFAAQCAYFHDMEYLNPLELDLPSHGDEPCRYGLSGPFDFGHTSACFLHLDLKALLDCDSILMLPGWENSHGAKIELLVARAIGLSVYSLEGEHIVPRPELNIAPDMGQ